MSDEEATGDASETGNAGPPLSKRLGFWGGLAALVIMCKFVQLDPASPQVSATAGVALLMAIWWVTEAVPLPATSLLPLALFPLLGVMKGSKVASIYTDSTIVLFIGGFFIALAMERWNLHRRIALNIIRIVGGQPHRLALGFMLATGCLSMWMSNTATAMMMTPMGLSLVLLYEDLIRKQTAESGMPPDPRARNFAVIILLSIAYAASIGGIGTLIGTPPNLVFVSVFKKEFPDAPAISFIQWLAFAAPLSLTIMVISWFLLCRWIYPLPKQSPFSGREFMQRQFDELGPIKIEEIQVLAVFALTAIFWIFRADMELGERLTIPGWSRLMPYRESIDDGTVAIVMGLLLFLLPASRKHGGALLDWNTAKKVPWGILLLFGGGFALAEGLTVSGLSKWIGSHFVIMKSFPPILTILGVSTVTTAVTEMASNMATIQMELPILASLARAIEVHPLLLMIPATISASLGFMMPMGTTPNMIAYGTEKFTMREMMKAGIYLNILCIILSTIWVYTVALPIFGISPGVFPEWAAVKP